MNGVITIVRGLMRRKFVQDTLALQISKVIIIGLSLVSSVFVVRLMGDVAYGTWGLVVSMVVTLQTLNLTGIGPSTSTRLATAIGAGDQSEILDLMAFYIKIATLWGALSIAAMLLLAPTLADWLYENPRIGTLAIVYTTAVSLDKFYVLVVIALQSRRSMRAVGTLQSVNQAVQVGTVIAVLFISPTAGGMVAARMTYSVLTLLIALVFYARLRGAGDVPYPAYGAVCVRALTVPVRRYWRFGVSNALDKNISVFYAQLSLQLVGAAWGEAAAGYLNLAQTAISRLGTLTGAVFDNMQAVVPQSVGRGDYARLWRNFTRVVGVLFLGGLGFYTAVAIAVPFLVPLIYGDSWQPAIPMIQALCVFGVVTTFGGVFGPLYRAFHLMRAAIVAKLVALGVMLPLGFWLVGQYGGVGGAWTTNGLFLISVLLTAAFTLPVLRRHAQDQTNSHQSTP